MGVPVGVELGRPRAQQIAGVLERGGARSLYTDENRIAWVQQPTYPALVTVLDGRSGAKSTYRLPDGTTGCVRLAGQALVYTIFLNERYELYAQPIR